MVIFVKRRSFRKGEVCLGRPMRRGKKRAAPSAGAAQRQAQLAVLPLLKKPIEQIGKNCIAHTSGVGAQPCHLITHTMP